MTEPERTYTKKEMAALMGMSLEVFQREIDDAISRPPVTGPNRAMRRAMANQEKER